jgi:hypothetical protein
MPQTGGLYATLGAAYVPYAGGTRFTNVTFRRVGLQTVPFCRKIVRLLAPILTLKIERR